MLLISVYNTKPKGPQRRIEGWIIEPGALCVCVCVCTHIQISNIYICFHNKCFKVNRKIYHAKDSKRFWKNKLKSDFFLYIISQRIVCRVEL